MLGAIAGPLNGGLFIPLFGAVVGPLGTLGGGPAGLGMVPVAEAIGIPKFLVTRTARSVDSTIPTTCASAVGFAPIKLTPNPT